MKKSFIFLVILCVAVVLPLPYLISGIGQADFIAYWSAARLFVTGRDPYSISDITELQISQYPERNTAEGNYLIVAWNPPWLNMFLSPFGMVKFETAVHLWLFLNLFLICLSVLLSWDLSRKPFDSKGFLFILPISLLFMQVFISLIIGQITSIILASFILSYWLITKKLDYLAGIALTFSAIKPHLIYFPLLLILIWSIRSNRVKIIFGFLSVIVFSGFVMWLVIPGWINEYIHLLRNLSNYRETTSTLGNLFGSLLGIEIFNYAFLLVLPLLIPFTRMLGKSLDFTLINVSILISLFFAPYGFGIDHILAIPSFVQMYSWIRRIQFPLRVYIISAIVYVFLNLLIILSLLLHVPVYWGVIFPLLFVIIFIYGWKFVKNSKTSHSYEFM